MSGTARDTYQVGIGDAVDIAAGRESPAVGRGGVSYQAMPSFAMNVKRMADYVGSVVALVLTFPVMLVIGALIALESRGPSLFRQQRVGRHGKPFVLYKFRTMVENAEEILRNDPELMERYRQSYKLNGSDPRLTRLGKLLRKTSLDELPQLLNVLRGEMSLIGPRPLVADEVKQYYTGMEHKLLAVKPGITGYWQAHGRNAIDYPERVDVELRYIDRFSLWLDVKILIRTVRAVVSCRDAH